MPVAREGKASSSGVFVALAGVTACAIAFRVFSAAVAFIANVAFLKDPNVPEPVSPFGGTRAFWDLFKAWDGGWYFQIAQIRRRATTTRRVDVGPL